MNLRFIPIVWLCVGPVMVLAQEPPATRPSPPGRPLHRWSGYDNWEEISAFYAKHSPIRWQLYQEVKDPDRRRFLGGVLRMQYSALKPLESENPALYRNKLQQIVLEDEVFGFIGRYRSADEPERKELRQKIRDRIARIFDLRLEERQRRIAELEQTLAAERERLSSDMRQRDSLIEQRAERILRGDIGSLGGEDKLPPPARFRRPPTRPEEGPEGGPSRDDAGRGGGGFGRDGPWRGPEGPGRGDRGRPPTSPEPVPHEP